LRYALAPMLILAFVGSSCVVDSPTAPVQTPAPPTPASVEVTALPATIETGETSVVTVTASRGGQPLSGSTVVVSTDFGTLTGGNTVSVTLGDNGSGTVTFTAPGDAGVATIEAQIEEQVASTTITVTSDDGQISVSPDVSLNHSRATSDCEDEIMPTIATTNLGETAITYRIVGTLPAWLRVDPMAGPVPSAVRAFFTCAVGSGNHDLSHTLVFQGVNAATGEDEGIEDSVTVSVQVRP